ncbi:hypothetical protein K9857_21745 [Pseudomonas sp. REP124]|uniref:hypothetical protein n=1 Tax=Pseudomonas sp. REP124 TaxID=2875731 RepID=UPI001CC9523C|nr:hypothetical protein [Pseudomonas sp. REP124]MBZ9784164.1 hypothetical protein [Pseudomonas sp. REP124]
MEKVISKGGRPKTDNPRTIISEVYLTREEAAELRGAAKKFGYAYLSQFLRLAALALIKQKDIGLDAKSAVISAYLSALASDINALNNLCSNPGMPSAAFVLSDSARRKILKLNETVQKK